MATVFAKYPVPARLTGRQTWSAMNIKEEGVAQASGIQPGGKSGGQRARQAVKPLARDVFVLILLEGGSDCVRERGL